MSNYEWKKSKTIYYSDELNDDFNKLDGVKRPSLKPNYNYVHRFFLRRLLDNFLYYVIAKPILGTYCLCHGIRFKNKKYLKLLKHQGAFLYGNHVAIADAYKFQAFIIHFKKVNIIGSSDASSIPVARTLVKAFGYLPIPDDKDNLLRLKDATSYLTKKRREYVLIYPEAHIWPYYTKVRPFKDVSFFYPAEASAPVVPFVTTWRKVFYSKKPRQTIIFGQPIFPREDLTVMENKKYLRDKCYEEMVKLANSVKQVEYIKYIKKES